MLAIPILQYQNYFFTKYLHIQKLYKAELKNQTDDSGSPVKREAIPIIDSIVITAIAEMFNSVFIVVKC